MLCIHNMYCHHTCSFLKLQKKGNHIDNFDQRHECSDSKNLFRSVVSSCCYMHHDAIAALLSHAATASLLPKQVAHFGHSSDAPDALLS